MHIHIQVTNNTIVLAILSQKKKEKISSRKSNVCENANIYFTCSLSNLNFYEFPGVLLVNSYPVIKRIESKVVITDNNKLYLRITIVTDEKKKVSVSVKCFPLKM